MTLVISGGEYKGRKIKAPTSNTTRPSSSKCRAALFNICQSKIEESCFLDLYSGSGAMGIEALSRGASFSIFIESNKNAMACIRENISSLELQSKSQLIQADASLAIKKISHKCDIIYVDPPYKFYDKQDFIADTLNQLSALDLLNEHCLVFFEAPSTYRSDSLGEILSSQFELIKERKYGSSKLFEIRYEKS